MTWSAKYDSSLKLVECTAVGFLAMDELSEATTETTALAKKKGTKLILVDGSKIEKTVKTTDIYDIP